MFELWMGSPDPVTDAAKHLWAFNTGDGTPPLVVCGVNKNPPTLRTCFSMFQVVELLHAAAPGLTSEQRRIVAENVGALPEEDVEELRVELARLRTENVKLQEVFDASWADVINLAEERAKRRPAAVVEPVA